MDLRLDRISKSFGSLRAVADVSLHVDKSAFFSLLGPSGCGKSTLLNMIAGFIRPDEGSIFIREEKVNAKAPYKRDTAMVFQSYALFPHLTVAQNVAFGLRYRGIERADRGPRVVEALARVRLTGLQERYPSQLSGGQQQRVALARALVVRPALLLLDEPLSNLDLRLRQEMREELLEIQRSIEVTTIYVTHDQSEAFAMSDRIAVMDSGHLVQVGSPEEIFLSPRSEFVVRFIGETNSFDCEVVSANGDGTVLRTPSGLVFESAKHGMTLSPHEQVRLHFREEQVRVARTQQQTANSFNCTIDRVQYLGAMLTYTARLATGELIRATTPNVRANQFNAGQNAVLSVDPADCVLVPRDAASEPHLPGGGDGRS
jgi:spermidine/putrescine ABC transporter ATP-binding subunit